MSQRCFMQSNKFNRFNQGPINPQEIDYKTQVARGKIPGASLFSGFGERNISGVVIEDIWPGPTAVQPIPPSSGIQMEISSSSTTDSYSLGTGLQEVELHYLDADGYMQSEILQMNGTTAVQTVATDIRFVQCIHVWSGTAAVGAITLVDVATSLIVYSFMPIGGTRCASSLRMVPKGTTLYISSAVGGSASGAGKRAVIRLEANVIDNDIIGDGSVFFPQGTVATQDSTVYGTFDPPIPLPELAIVKGEADTSGSSFVSFSYFGWLETN